MYESGISLYPPYRHIAGTPPCTPLIGIGLALRGFLRKAVFFSLKRWVGVRSRRFVYDTHRDVFGRAEGTSKLDPGLLPSEGACGAFPIDNNLPQVNVRGDQIFAIGVSKPRGAPARVIRLPCCETRVGWWELTRALSYTPHRASATIGLLETVGVVPLARRESMHDNAFIHVAWPVTGC